MFIAGLLTMNQEWKLTKCPSVDGWTNSMCSLHTMEYYSITKKGELLTSAITWMNLEHILLLFSRSVMSDSATPWTAACQDSLSFTISWSLFKLMSIKSVMPSNHLILCHPLLLLPSIFPSIRVFTNESALCIRWPKYRSFSFTIRPSNEYSGLISFRVDWFDILAVQGTLKSLQHYNSKASVLQCSALWSNSLTRT